jgi:ATP-dependent Lon protease
MGLNDIIIIKDEVLKIIIEDYTCESGVRKLKEILFEIIGEINLDLLNYKQTVQNFPINVTIEDIKDKYFKDKQQSLTKKIHMENKIGIINGLWANGLGLGGIIPIQCNYYPVNNENFLNLKLTGLQGDVMKESMNVALTLAWTLTNDKIKKNLEIKNKHNGIHIHCPEGGVPKDGPSAGTAITTCIYSLLNNLKIKNYIAITGEITLDGSITAIGGLDIKILGGIKANVKEFIYPQENKKDFDAFISKYKNNSIIENIIFHAVNRIEEVFDIIFIK